MSYMSTISKNYSLYNTSYISILYIYISHNVQFLERRFDIKERPVKCHETNSEVRMILCYYNHQLVIV